MAALQPEAVHAVEGDGGVDRKAGRRFDEDFGSHESAGEFDDLAGELVAVGKLVAFVFSEDEDLRSFDERDGLMAKIQSHLYGAGVGDLTVHDVAAFELDSDLIGDSAGGDGNDFAGIGVAGTGFHDALHRKWPQNGTAVDSSGRDMSCMPLSCIITIWITCTMQENIGKRASFSKYTF